MAKLTSSEKTALKESGYSQQDLREIESAIPKTSYRLILDKSDYKEISEAKAMELLGRKEWLKGISRSTFYVETVREGLKGEKILMYSRIWSR